MAVTTFVSKEVKIIYKCTQWLAETEVKSEVQEEGALTMCFL